MPYSKSFWGVDDSGSWVLVEVAAVKQGKRLRINIASFILNEAGFTAAHPPKHSPPHGAPLHVPQPCAAAGAAAAALKYIWMLYVSGR